MTWIYSSYGATNVFILGFYEVKDLRFCIFSIERSENVRLVGCINFVMVLRWCYFDRAKNGKCEESALIV